METFEGLTLRVACSTQGNIREGRWYLNEIDAAKRNKINLEHYRYIGHMPGMTTRGQESTYSAPGYVDGYELYLCKKGSEKCLEIKEV